MYESIQKAVGKISSLHPGFTPQIGIILGTGLGRLADTIDVEQTIAYEQIPGFVTSTVEMHAGKLILGTLKGRRVVAMQGRFHFYEGYSLQQIVFPVRVMKVLGAESLIVSNACGGINPYFKAGGLMAIEDHINLFGISPLVGPNDERIGPRFPDMSRPYDEGYLQLAAEQALKLGIELHKGVYAGISGPNLETRAEYRMLKILGADAIGMSTVPEVIAAVHCGLKVLGLSVITDECLPDALEPVDIKKIIAAAAAAEPQLVSLIKNVVGRL